MKIKNYKIRKKTEGFCHVLNLTEESRNKVLESGIREGQMTLFVSGSTAGLTTAEFEPGLIRDLEEIFEKLAPQNADYHHEETWHDGNGFSHVRAALLKPSLTVPLIAGELTLGTWQQIVLIDFDNRPRTRELVLQVMGA